MSKHIDTQANTYSLIEFQSKYGIGKSCEQTLFQLKWPDGFKCLKCSFAIVPFVGERRLSLYQSVPHMPPPDLCYCWDNHGK